MPHHQHSDTASDHSHQPRVQRKWTAIFLEHMHDTEVWASYLPRIPGYISGLAILGMILVIASFIGLWAGSTPFKFISLTAGFLLTLPALVMGGFALRKWSNAQQLRKQILDPIQWRGDESVLDIGCGSGLLLNGAAMRLTSGKGTGIDIWAKHSGGGNFALLMKNAQVEGVADKIHFKQADARNMPFEDSSFDIVVSSGALHHITNSFEDHDKLTHEIARVLKPGGQIAIWDLSHMVEATALKLKSFGIESEVKHTPSYLGFDMSMLTGRKTGKA